MRNLEVDEIKKIASDILAYIKLVCERNNIQYYLAYGTVLGAIRHKGFIPWDDDIDVCMTRDNFNKFSEAMKNDTESPYELLYLDNEKYTLPLPKVVDTRTELSQYTQREKMLLGVYVDVFILDNVPDDRALRERFYKKLGHLQTCWTYAQYKWTYRGKSVKQVIYELLHFYVILSNPRHYAMRLEKLAAKYSSADTLLMGTMTFAGYGRSKETFEKRIFGKGSKAIFEGNEYVIPELYDEYLTFLYKDYMQLPPEDKRCSRHSFIAYHKNEK